MLRRAIPTMSYVKTFKAYDVVAVKSNLTDQTNIRISMETKTRRNLSKNKKV